MRILVTNDDGIHAEGLDVLERIARQLSDDVWVVAPETDQSGVAHSLSLSNPLRLRQISEKRFAVAGNGILAGAVLQLFVPDSTTPPTSTGPLGQIPTIEFRLPIHPTSEVLLDGRRVWQTAVEIEPHAEEIVRGLEKGAETIWAPPPLRFVFMAMRHLPRPVWRKLKE